MKDEEESKLKDLKANNYVFQFIDRSILETILMRNTTKDFWDAMPCNYHGSSKVKKANLKSFNKEFEVLAMGQTEIVGEYFAKKLAIANRMTAHGEKL